MKAINIQSQLESSSTQIDEQKWSQVWQWFEHQTQFHNLILYCYLFWYCWIMLRCQAIFEMNGSDMLMCLMMSFFVGVALNSSAYRSPFKKYMANIFQIGRFFLIPFCVSSLSIGCTKSNQCHFLFPTESSKIVQQWIFQLLILIIGLIIHYVINKLRKDQMDAKLEPTNHAKT